VVRAVAGFGASAVIHTEKILRLSLDLPVVVEVVDTEEAIQSVLPDLDDMIGGGLVTLERVRVILYRSADVPDGERSGTGLRDSSSACARISQPVPTGGRHEPLGIHPPVDLSAAGARVGRVRTSPAVARRGPFDFLPA
jgi:hypothetical protein